MSNKDNFINIREYLESFSFENESPCPYYDGKSSREKIILSQVKLPKTYMDTLFRAGYRRSGDYFYRQQCRGCQLCIGYRIPVDNFQPDRSQRRNLSKNSLLEIRVVPPHPTPEKEKLYLEYQYHQHYLRAPHEKPVEKEFDPEETLNVMNIQMYGNTKNSVEMEVYHEGRLVGFSIIDVGDISVSAVYSVYSIADKKMGLGIFLILKMLEWAKQRGYKFLYLGHYIPGHSKMDYKARFQPAQYLDANSSMWRDFNINAPLLALFIEDNFQATDNNNFDE